MSAAREALPQTFAAMERGIESALHAGAQIYVSLRGTPIADFALGESSPAVVMQPGTLNPWLSSGKPLTAVAVAQQFEKGRLSFSDRVGKFIPEFAQQGKEEILIEHLLTHTAGFRGADALPEDLSWDETIRRICYTRLEPAWPPGQRAGYQMFSSWFILAEIICRLEGRPFDRYVRECILEPMDLHDSWVGVPAERIAGYGDRIGMLYVSERGELKPNPKWNTAEAIAACRPGSNVRGPIRELGKFYEALLCARSARTKPGLSLLRPDTVQHLTRAHRVGLFDHTFRHTLDWGLGFHVDSKRYGASTVPYGYGPHASDQTFGHSGSQSSCAFADPVHELVVAWMCNGQPGEPLHQRRAREINTSIYDDLGLVFAKTQPVA